MYTYLYIYVLCVCIRVCAMSHWKCARNLLHMSVRVRATRRHTERIMYSIMAQQRLGGVGGDRLHGLWVLSDYFGFSTPKKEIKKDSRTAQAERSRRMFRWEKKTMHLQSNAFMLKPWLMSALLTSLGDNNVFSPLENLRIDSCQKGGIHSNFNQFISDIDRLGKSFTFVSETAANFFPWPGNESLIHKLNTTLDSENLNRLMMFA